jgi:hypothetical protein
VGIGEDGRVRDLPSRMKVIRNIVNRFDHEISLLQHHRDSQIVHKNKQFSEFQRSLRPRDELQNRELI